MPPLGARRSFGPQPGGGVLTTGALYPVMPYTEIKQTWGAAPRAKHADRLSITLTNVAAITIDVRRAHVDCGVTLSVNTDGPVRITLLGCGTTIRVSA